MRRLPRGSNLKCFDRIGDIDLQAIDAGVVQDRIEDLARRADERLAGKILLVARLLADEDHLCAFRTFAEHGLRCVAPQRAAAAGPRRFARLLEGRKCGFARRLPATYPATPAWLRLFPACEAEGMRVIISAAIPSASSNSPGMNKASAWSAIVVSACRSRLSGKSRGCMFTICSRMRRRKLRVCALTPRAGRDGSRVRRPFWRHADTRPA